jgi:hypothetical protein
VLLALPAVWDAARTTGGQEWQIRMYSDLVRQAKPEFVTGPAILLALCALWAGNGALGRVSVGDLAAQGMVFYSWPKT